MKGSGKRRLIVLGAASALSVGGIAYLAMKAATLEAVWALAATTSPLAVRCLVIIAAGMVALGLVVCALFRARPGRRGTGARAAGIAADEGGTAAVEMTLLFPFALMIFLIITQAALLFNTNVVVNYAAYCAARMATTAVPLEIGNELRNLVYNPEVATNPPSEKLELIRRAAVLALVPISASLEDASANGDLPGAGGGTAVESQTKSVFERLGGDAEPWFRRIRKQYNYANAYAKIDLAKPGHWRTGDRDSACPYRHQRRGDWTQWGWEYRPYCPFHDERMDYWYWEDLHVRLVYRYLLEVPLAARLMGEACEVPGRRGKSFCQEIKVITTLSNEGGPEIRPRD